MDFRKLLLIILVVLGLCNPLTWRIFGPILLVGLGLGIWCLVFHGIVALGRNGQTDR